MVFQSFTYLVFLTVVLAGWLVLRAVESRVGGRLADGPLRKLWLLGASYLFYGWVTHWWLILITVHTVVDFTCIRLISREEEPRRRKWLLGVSLGTSFCILATFKYFGFFVENVTQALAAAGVSAAWLTGSPVAAFLLKIGLPAGISFFTFQGAGFVIDVYRRTVAPPRGLLDYALFVAFFPQLVAGPIDRHGNLLRQIERGRRFCPVRVRSGLLLIVWGLFQKIVIADSTALLANKVFALGAPSFPVLWGGVLCFGVQIYADFSGYTDMARGTARLFGIELLPNFRHPYAAQSPPDFWRRWHMTLSTWFRDYVYFPLGGSRGGVGRTARNLVMTFLVSGLWHGASWNFVLWGAWHGMLVAAWPWLSRWLPWLAVGSGGKVATVLRVTLTFALVHVGWLMFREHSGGRIVAALGLNPFTAGEAEWRMGLGLAMEAVLYGLPLMVGLPLLARRGLLPGPDDDRLPTWKWTWLQAGAAAACVTGIVFLRCDVGSDFIYFAF